MAHRETFPCPTCGEEVPVGAKACPSCGADENTGWSENTVYDGADIPDPGEMDYAEILEKEGLAKPKRSPVRVAVILLTFLLLAAFLLLYVLSH
jgi:hypothetical protein